MSITYELQQYIFYDKYTFIDYLCKVCYNLFCFISILKMKDNSFKTLIVSLFTFLYIYRRNKYGFLRKI